MTNAIARLTEQLIGSLRYWVHHLHLDLDRFARDDWVPWSPWCSLGVDPCVERWRPGLVPGVLGVETRPSHATEGCAPGPWGVPLGALGIPDGLDSESSGERDDPNATKG